MSTDDFVIHDCDLCGSDDAAEIEVALHYTRNQPLHVCKNCGFIFARKRRSAQRIAEVWSDDLYETKYTARIPSIKARQVYVAEFIDTSIGLKDKTVCDIGGGEGQFLEMIGAPEYGAKPFAIEPSKKNCRMMTDAGIENFCGSIGDYQVAEPYKDRKFDIVTIMWTLETCTSANDMLQAAYDALVEGGNIVVSTGSRIMVPFKKPLHFYLWAGDPDKPRNLDTHCIFFSANSLRGLFAVNGFETIHINRYIDTDWLVVVAQKTDRTKDIPREKDDYQEVIDFFKRWDKETREHYKDA